MHRVLRTGLMLLLAVTCASTAGATALAAGYDDDAWAKDAKVLSEAADKEDCETARPVIRRMTAYPAFRAAPENAQQAVLAFGAECATDPKEGLDYARLATALPAAPDYMWLARLFGDANLGELEDFAATAETLARTNPRVLDKVTVQTLIQVQTHERDAGGRGQIMLRVLTVLDKVDYRPAKPTDSADYLWLTYATLLADAGDSAHASLVLTRISSTESVLPVRLDGRFSAAVAADPERFDVSKAAERALQADRAVMAAHPELILASVAVVRDLRALGRDEDALALAQSVLDRASHAPKGKPAFTDQDDNLNWVEDAKAYALLESGRTEEAIALERTAAARLEDGVANVSQTINLAGILEEADRPKEVLEVLKGFTQPHEQASGYGFGWVMAYRACANERLGAAAARDAALAYLSAHKTDNPGARLMALLCVNDLDAAAGYVISDLADGQRRAQTLVNLSEFAPRPHPSAFDKLMDARIAALRARPDVQAAIAKVGHTERLPLNSNIFRDMF